MELGKTILGSQLIEKQYNMRVDENFKANCLSLPLYGLTILLLNNTYFIMNQLLQTFLFYFL